MHSIKIPDLRISRVINTLEKAGTIAIGDPLALMSAGMTQVLGSIDKKAWAAISSMRGKPRLFSHVGSNLSTRKHGGVQIMSPDTEPNDRGTSLAETRTDLAIQRTTMASDRSLMAWIRTALSMIGFGFSIVKFFQYMPGEPAADIIARPNAPRNLGLTLIALGTLGLVAATWQHQRLLNTIESFQMRHLWSLSFVVAIFVILVGCITFYGVLYRHGPF